jgi:hypothetical protein
MTLFNYYVKLGSEENLIKQIIDGIDSLSLDFEKLSENTPDFFINNWHSELKDVKKYIREKKFDLATQRLEIAKISFNDNWIIPHIAFQDVINLKITIINRIIDQIKNLKLNHFKLTIQPDQIS